MGFLSHEPGSLLGNHLFSLSEQIKDELSGLAIVFRDDVLPRANRIGAHLCEARSRIPSTEAFYLWARDSCGLKDRQIRNYIRIHRFHDQIIEAADHLNQEITSIDGALALLNAVQSEEEDESTVLLKRCFTDSKRAHSAIDRALQSAREVDPGIISAEDLEVLQKAMDVLTRFQIREDRPKLTDSTMNPAWSIAAF